MVCQTLSERRCLPTIQNIIYGMRSSIDLHCSQQRKPDIAKGTRQQDPACWVERLLGADLRFQIVHASLLYSSNGTFR